MKKIINGVKYETFAPDKNSKELGIDTSRKFIVIDGCSSLFRNGEIVHLKKDDSTYYPRFENERKASFFHWSKLAYYYEPKEYKFRVGDKVKIYKPKVLDGNPSWKPEMEEYNGQVLIINNITERENIQFKTNPWYFSPDWLELVEKASGVILEEVEPNVTANIYASTYSNVFTGNETFTKESLSKAIEMLSSQLPKAGEPLKLTSDEEKLEKLGINLNKQNKFMSIITNAFKSKENKALEHFNLGTTDKLNEQGRNEFTDFIYETGTTDKKEFFKRIVKAHEEDTK